MKILGLLLILTPLIHIAQKNTFSTIHANLSFDYYKKDLTDIVKSEIDSIWDIMKNGSEAEFHLLSKEEKKKLPNDHKYKLTVNAIGQCYSLFASKKNCSAIHVS